MAWRRSPSSDPGRRSSVRQRPLHARVRVAAPWRRSGMARPADSAACRLVFTEPRGVPALRGARLWHRRAVRLDTLTPASSRAAPPVMRTGTNPPTARRVGRRRRAGLPSARSSSLRSASPGVARFGRPKGRSALARIEQALAPASIVDAALSPPLRARLLSGRPSDTSSTVGWPQTVLGPEA
jgi:hypothetical protein